MQRFTSTVYWDCPRCSFSNKQDIAVPELDFSAEKMSEMGSDDWIEVQCDGCEVSYSGTVYVHSDSTQFVLQEPEVFEFQGDMPRYEPSEIDDLDYEPPDDPASIALEALNQLYDMVGAESPANDPQFTNRLIFAGAISCFEAYLGDTLINAVQEDTVVRASLVEKNAKLGAIKATAAELSKDPEVLSKRIVKELRGILYHNLSVVTALFRDAFGVELLAQEQQKQIFFPL